MQQEPNAGRDLCRVATAAAAETAEELLRYGFDEAAADGPNLTLRSGKTIWRVINSVHYRPGAREQVLDQVARFIVQSLVNSHPTGSQQ